MESTNRKQRTPPLLKAYGGNYPHGCVEPLGGETLVMLQAAVWAHQKGGGIANISEYIQDDPGHMTGKHRNYIVD